MLGRVHVVETDVEPTLEQHAADQREHRQPRVHEQRDAQHQRQRIADRRFDDERENSHDERDETEDQHVVAAQPPDQAEHPARIQRLHDRAGRALHGDDGRQNRADRERQHQRAALADPVARSVGRVEQPDRQQQHDHRALLAERVDHLDGQHRRLGHAFGEMIHQHERVLAEPGQQDQAERNTEEAGLDGHHQQHAECADQQQRRRPQRDGEIAEDRGRAHARDSTASFAYNSCLSGRGRLPVIAPAQSRGSPEE